jgi:hypothetical protein
MRLFWSSLLALFAAGGQAREEPEQEMKAIPVRINCHKITLGDLWELT